MMCRTPGQKYSKASKFLAAIKCGSLAFSVFSSIALAKNSPDLTQKIARSLVPFYEQLHRNPELSHKEAKTSEALASKLRQQGFTVTHPFAGFGVVAIVENGKGPVVMLRTDLDALPVKEETKLPYASTRAGVMHACGHDLHITNMVGTAAYLIANKTRWHGTAMIIGQPAEEKGAGARAMIKAGLFKKFPKPDYALALHVDASNPTGTATLNSGPVTANVDSMEIKMIGKDGHGARPHDTIDPIPMASELVLSLQSLISREKNPNDPAVVTVGSFHAGTKHNIISSSATLQLTIRTFSPESRKLILDGLKRKARGIAQAYGAPAPKITSSEFPVPSVFNSGKVVETIKPVFIEHLGNKNVLQSPPWTVGEDFSFYGAQGIPSVLFSIGTIAPNRIAKYKKKKNTPNLHSGTYFPSVEESLTTGIPLLAESAIALFNTH